MTGWRYWRFDPPHPLYCATVEWVIGDEEGPGSDTPIAGDVVELLACEAAGDWPCLSVSWQSMPVELSPCSPEVA